MTAEEESRKTKQEQGEGRHRPRFLDYMVIKVKQLSANRILANHKVRDAILGAGTDGMAECYDKLAGILASSAEATIAAQI
jgi:hypothetical protein